MNLEDVVGRIMDKAETADRRALFAALQAALLTAARLSMSGPRDEFLRENLSVNEVTRHLHMSGECLCGAFARPSELEEIRFFYPDVAARIDALAERVKAAGLPNFRWGERPPKKEVPAPGPLCNQCALWDDEKVVT